MNQRLVRFPFSIISLVSVETPFYGSIDGPSYGSKTDNRTAVPLPFLNEAMVCIRASRRIAEATMPGRMWYATLCPVPSCDISTKIFPAKEKDIGGWLSVSCQVWRYRLGSLLIDRVSWASPFEENGASAPCGFQVATLSAIRGEEERTLLDHTRIGGQLWFVLNLPDRIYSETTRKSPRSSPHRPYHSLHNGHSVDYSRISSSEGAINKASSPCPTH